METLEYGKDFLSSFHIIVGCTRIIEERSSIDRSIDYQVTLVGLFKCSI